MGIEDELTTALEDLVHSIRTCDDEDTAPEFPELLRKKPIATIRRAEPRTMRKVLDKITRERSSRTGPRDRREPKGAWHSSVSTSKKKSVSAHRSQCSRMRSASRSTSGSCCSLRADSPRGRAISLASSRSSMASSFGQVHSDATILTSYSNSSRTRIVRRQLSPRTRLHTLKLQDSSSGGEPPEPMKSPSTEKLKTIMKPRCGKFERQGSKAARQSSRTAPDRA